MKKSLKIFALAASLLQAALFSAFAANPPSDFTYEFINNSQALKITGVKNNKAEYVVPSSIEDFPVTEVYIFYRDTKDCNITLPEGCLNVSISRPWDSSTIITVNQLPSSVKELELGGCNYNGTLPVEIEDVSISGSAKQIKLNQQSSELKNLKKLYINGGGYFWNTNLPFDLSESQNLESLNLGSVDFTKPLKLESLESLKSLKEMKLHGVQFVNKTLSISKNVIENKDSCILNTNVEELIFEEGVTEIRSNFVNRNGKFEVGNDSLKRIVLPSTLKKIEYNAFTHCPNLSEIVIPDSLRKIETNASKLEDIFDTTSLTLKNQARLNEIFSLKN